LGDKLRISWRQNAQLLGVETRVTHSHKFGYLKFSAFFELSQIFFKTLLGTLLNICRANFKNSKRSSYSVYFILVSHLDLCSHCNFFALHKNFSPLKDFDSIFLTSRTESCMNCRTLFHRWDPNRHLMK